MKFSEFRHRNADRGVALVIVLGLLSLLTLLAVAFAISMRIERLAARNFANGVRAEMLLQAGLVEAMRKVDVTMQGRSYPNWTNEITKRRDVLCSSGGAGAEKVTNMLSDEAINMVPGALMVDAQKAADDCSWSSIWVDSKGDGKVDGRIGYVVINGGGLLDANIIGGEPRKDSTRVQEIDISALPDVNDVTAFYANRPVHRRYEQIAELAKLNADELDDPVANLFVYSLDPGREQMPTDLDTIGTLNTVLTNRLNINAFTNCSVFTDPVKNLDWQAYTKALTGAAGEQDANFKAYYDLLLKYLEGGQTFVVTSALRKPIDVAINIINYVDKNRLPQIAQQQTTPYPWNVSECIEDIPMINEIVLRKAEGQLANKYQFDVELWYPFVPNVVEDTDRFYLEVGVFTNYYGGPDVPALPTPGKRDIMSYKYEPWSFGYKVEPMGFYEDATHKQFRFYPSPPTNWIEFADKGPIGGNNKVWFLARLWKGDDTGGGNYVSNIVDESMGYWEDNGHSEAHDNDDSDKRKIQRFESEVGYSVSDPRSNGQRKYWGLGTEAAINSGYSYPASQHTLGAMNVNCFPWGDEGWQYGKSSGPPKDGIPKGQGLPIFHRNGPMLNIGEIGNIWWGNMDDEWKEDPASWWWVSLNILSYDYGAFLLDRLTVGPTNCAATGLVSISSAQCDALKSLWHNTKIGPTNVMGYADHELIQFSNLKLQDLVQKIITKSTTNNIWCFQSLFDKGWEGGDVGRAFRAVATDPSPNGFPKCDVHEEDMLRNILNMITFRQNIFVIILAAQVMGPDGAATAEKRAVATVYRDAYTGRHFVRSFKWLSE